MIYTDDDDEFILGRAAPKKSGKAQWETMGKIRSVKEEWKRRKNCGQ
jgi:hypothetical protein